MKITINPKVYRGGDAHKRKTRRLVYIAMAARSLGHEVTLHMPDGTPGGGYDFLHYLDRFDSSPRINDTDLYVCSSGTVFNAPKTLPDCPIVTWKELLDYSRDAELARRCAVIACYVWRPEDFARESNREPFDEAYGELIRSKILQVPWLPHEKVLEQLDRDNLTGPYIVDNVEAIRGMYESPRKYRDVGFIGRDWPHRKAIVESLGDKIVSCFWTGRGMANHMASSDYLRWLSECQAVLCLPGDTWGCSRFAEAVMMGVPAIIKRGTLSYTPPAYSLTAIMLSDWNDAGTWDIGTASEAALQCCVNRADDAYRSGWSLRGQLTQAIRKAAE